MRYLIPPCSLTPCASCLSPPSWIAFCVALSSILAPSAALGGLTFANWGFQNWGGGQRSCPCNPRWGPGGFWQDLWRGASTIHNRGNDNNDEASFPETETTALVVLTAWDFCCSFGSWRAGSERTVQPVASECSRRNRPAQGTAGRTGWYNRNISGSSGARRASSERAVWAAAPKSSGGNRQTILNSTGLAGGRSPQLLHRLAWSCFIDLTGLNPRKWLIGWWEPRILPLCPPEGAGDWYQKFPIVSYQRPLLAPVLVASCSFRCLFRSWRQVPACSYFYGSPLVRVLGCYI
uniref:Uncharacterized protein n=1 Tax=Sphaerodactylus townsendi TaxID=933632 RepID=A0ACB8ELY4_9SAUR